MITRTQLQPACIPGRPYGSFAGGREGGHPRPNNGAFTQLSVCGWGTRQYGSFNGRGSRPRSGGLFTQLTPGCWGGRLYGTFRGRSGSFPRPGIGAFTQLYLGAWGGRQYGSFANRFVIPIRPIPSPFSRWSPMCVAAPLYGSFAGHAPFIPRIPALPYVLNSLNPVYVLCDADTSSVYVLDDAPTTIPVTECR